MASTYTPIATTTATGSSSSVTFSSIPSTYTDLVLVINASAAATDFYMRFNGDTTSQYSQTYLKGNGTAAASGRNSGTLFYLDWSGFTTGSIQSNAIINIQNYANNTTYKTAIWRFNDASTTVETHVGLWRKTPEAINSITINAGSTITSGSTFTLYGIKAA